MVAIGLTPSLNKSYVFIRFVSTAQAPEVCNGWWQQGALPHSGASVYQEDFLTAPRRSLSSGRETAGRSEELLFLARFLRSSGENEGPQGESQTAKNEY